MKKALMVASNILAFICLLCMMATASIMRWVLPPGAGGHRYGFSQRFGIEIEPKTFLGWGRHDWGSLHFWVAVVFVGMLVVHLALNWTWIKGTFFTRRAAKTANAKPAPPDSRTMGG